MVGNISFLSARERAKSPHGKVSDQRRGSRGDAKSDSAPDVIISQADALGLMRMCKSVLEVTASFKLVPRPHNFLKLFFLAAVTTVHVRVQNLDKRLIGFANLGFGPCVFRLQNLDGAAFCRGQAAPCGGTFSRILRGIFTKHLVRILDAQSGPRAGLWIAQRFRGAFPDFILGHLRV